MFKFVVLSGLLAIVAQATLVHNPITGAVSHQRMSTPVLTSAALLAGQVPYVAGTPWSAYAAHQVPWAAGIPNLAAARLQGASWGIPSPLAYSGLYPGHLGQLGQLGYAARMGYGNYW